MRYVTISLLMLFAFSAYSQCSGLEIVAYNSDNADQIVFEATANIPGGTVFYITDNEWNGTSFNTGENNVTWTAPPEGVAMGSTILIQGATATCGTASGTPALSTSGEEIYITSVTTAGSPNVAASDICHAVLFGGNGTITGITNAIDNGNFDNWDGTTTSNTRFTTLAGSCTLLPVSLSSFNGKIAEQRTILSFTTATEENNSHFLIQHSTDGRTFATIGEVAGKGDSNERVDYTFTHDKPAQGMNYYRLQQFDFDGTNEYFGPVAVRFGNRTDKEVFLFPNPTADRIQLELPETDTNWNIDLYDLNGRKVLSMDVEEKTTTTNLDLSRLPAGQYFLRWQSGQDIGQERIIRL